MTPIASPLDEHSIGIVRECLKAAADGPFFPEWEFQTLFGVDRETVRRVHGAWPDQAADDADFSAVVVNCLNNLVGYPHGQETVWSKYISVDAKQVRTILRKLIAAGF